MAFNDILGKRTLNKKVDPGVGSQQATPPPTGPENKRVVTETDPSKLLEDLRERVEEVANLTLSTIQEVEQEGRGFPAFDSYSSVLRQSFFDAREVLRDPTARPAPISVPEVRRLQREVYRATLSSRQPRLWDLWRILEQLRVLQATYDYCWNAIVNGNPLYSKPKQAMKKVRETLQRELRSIDQLQFEVERIRNSQIQPLQDSFAGALADQLLQDFQNSLGSLDGKKADSTLQRLLQLETLLMDTGLECEAVFESLDHALHEMYGNVLDYLGRCILLAQPFLVVNGVQTPVLEFLVGMDDPTLDAQVSDIIEFEQQIQQALFRNAKKVEDALVSRENYNAHHSRQMMEDNLVKKAKNQQFLRAVKAAQAHVEALGKGATSLQESIKGFEGLAESIKSIGRVRF